jgi:hypothetical protein
LSGAVDSKDRLSFCSSALVTANNGSKNLSSSRNPFSSRSDFYPKSAVAQSPSVQARKGGHAVLRRGLNRSTNMKSKPALVQLPRDISSSPPIAKRDRNFKPLPRPKHHEAEELSIGQLSSPTSSDTEVPEVHETKTERFSHPMVYRRKTYYSDDELSWGDNSDIDDEGSFLFNPAPASQPSGQVQ